MTDTEKSYDILEEGMHYVGAKRIRAGQKTVMATEAEAEYFVANGGLKLTEDKPADDKAKPKAPAKAG